MKNRIWIEVTEGDIKLGVAGNPAHCPIAVSLKRIGFITPLVLNGEFNAYAGENLVRYRLPSQANRFMSHFDSENRVKPFAFRATQIAVRGK